jgi:hypothetical protein
MPDLNELKDSVVRAAIKWRDQEREANTQGGDHQRKLVDRQAALRLAIDDLEEAMRPNEKALEQPMPLQPEGPPRGQDAQP